MKLIENNRAYKLIKCMVVDLFHVNHRSNCIHTVYRQLREVYKNSHCIYAQHWKHQTSWTTQKNIAVTSAGCTAHKPFMVGIYRSLKNAY